MFVNFKSSLSRLILPSWHLLLPGHFHCFLLIVADISATFLGLPTDHYMYWLIKKHKESVYILLLVTFFYLISSNLPFLGETGGVGWLISSVLICFCSNFFLSLIYCLCVRSSLWKLCDGGGECPTTKIFFLKMIWLAFGAGIIQVTIVIDTKTIK